MGTSEFTCFAALLLCTTLSFVTGTVFNIVPTIPDDTTCPGGSQPCLTLSEFASSNLSVSNITLILFPGVHQLDHQLSVVDINYFAMKATNATVDCSHHTSNISFYDTQYVLLSGVVYSGCSRNLVSSVTEFVLEDSVIQNSVRVPALQIVNTTASIVQSSIQKNENYDKNYGILNLENSSVLITECYVSDNRGHPTGGGIIYSVNSIIAMDRSEISKNYFDYTFYDYNYNYDYNNRYDYYYDYDYRGDDFRGWFHALSDSGNTSTITIQDCVFTYNTGNALIYGKDVCLVIERSSFLHNENYGQTYTSRFTYEINGAVLYTIHNYYSTAKLEIYNCNFERNGGQNGVGRAIFSRNTDITIVDSNFHSNYYTSNDGYVQGAALTAFGSTVTILKSRFANNIVDGSGGALYIASSKIIIERSTFHQNRALAGSGGAVNLHGSTLDISLCRFAHNVASFSGGALYTGAENITITDATFSNNVAFDKGGAISVEPRSYYSHTEHSLTVDNSTFSHNMATIGGGVVHTKMTNAVFFDSTFGCNTVNQEGNLVYATDNSDITIKNSGWVGENINTSNLLFTDTSSTTTTENFTFHAHSCSPPQDTTSLCQVVYVSTSTATEPPACNTENSAASQTNGHNYGPNDYNYNCNSNRFKYPTWNRN